MAEKAVHDKNFRYLVRISNTDLDGNKPLYTALTKIKGISFIYSNAVCSASGFDKNTKTGMLTDKDIEKIDSTLRNMVDLVPTWLLNRRADPTDGVSRHLVLGELQFAQDQDIRMMKKSRNYKGVRHSLGQPVRGQRTRSNFRRNKGKGPGVVRSKTAKAAQEDK